MKALERVMAQTVSWLFHPLLMPTAGVLIIFYSSTTESLMPVVFRKYIYILVFGGTFVLPLCFLPLYYYRKPVSFPYLEGRTERNSPLFFTFVFYLLTAYYLYRLPVRYLFVTVFFIFAAALSVLMNYLVNLRWKISSHAIGAGGMTGLVVALRMLQYEPPLIFLILSILMSGLVLWARMYLQKHSWKQVTAGFIAGFLCVSVIVFFFSRQSWF